MAQLSSQTGHSQLSPICLWKCDLKASIDLVDMTPTRQQNDPRKRTQKPVLSLQRAQNCKFYFPEQDTVARGVSAPTARYSIVGSKQQRLKKFQC